jgi:hypothetical protein
MTMLEWALAAAGIGFLLWSPATFAYSASFAGRRWGAKDRLALFAGFGAAALGLAFGRAYAPWDLIPPALWAIPAAATAWGVLAGAWAWPALPPVAARRPWLRVASVVTGVAIYAVLIVLVV